MARGKGKRKFNQKGGKHQKKNKPPGKKQKTSSNGRDIKHRDQFKRPFPDTTEKGAVKRRKVEGELPEEDSDEEVDAYKQLLSTFSQKNTSNNLAVESEDEDDVEDDEDVSDVSSVPSDIGEHNLDGTGRKLSRILRNGSEDDRECEPDEENRFLVDERGPLDENGEVDEVPEVEGDSSGNDSNSSDVDVEDEDIELQDSQTQEDPTSIVDDPFVTHICRELSDEAADLLGQPKPPVKVENIHWKALGRLVVTLPQIPGDSSTSDSIPKLTLEEPKKFVEPAKVPVRSPKLDLNQLHVKVQLHDTICKANQVISGGRENEILTPLQLELFTLMNSYQDLYYPERTLQNGEEVRFSYCLHVANHIIKTRNTVLHHNARLNKKNSTDVPDEFRDQGLVRPKVLIVVPFREQARRVVEILIKLLVRNEDKGGVMNKKRFDEEFTGEELAMSKKNPKPEDYQTMFSGNTDDTFRIGLTLTKKCLKLYADFYSADIIISSPLGLRMIVGAEGEAERDYDFLASIEVLILDQADVFLMQNWDHLLHVLDHLHLQPKESHGTDFSRVRLWAANGWSKFYRQTIILSSTALIEFSSLLNKRCNNFAGSVRVVNPVSTGTICQVVVQVPQVFQRLEAASVTQSLDVRFDFLVRKVIPDHTDPLMGHTMIYVPSYFDYVRIRNYLRKQDLSFVQICEYSKEGKVARARDMFYHSQVQFLLYSERFHFFRRPLIKGIRHIIFYQPPSVPHFYSEMCNQMQEANQNPYGGSENNMTVTVLYNKFDAPQLSAIVGSERASRMISSDRNVHMFMAGE
ncbi:Digestive organ expansion factor-like protein [Frankliniella fusca]|uniref:U3 small nucleolar RNA-associated protein 25 homolog n=1 Tax=Frankliniella fusca TaxID=407009 RepID=A0AAE1LJ85_9NEOP|nr:Digestive organ expansion factor-like protein [Frankliniella fusca]